MLPGQHATFPHHNPYGAPGHGPDWQAQQQAHHGQHYGRMPFGNNMTAGPEQHANVNDNRGLAMNAHSNTGAPGAPNGQPHVESMGSEELRRVLDQIAQMMRMDTRESALLELSKKREQVSELALILWHSFGVMTSLLQEIISVYPMLNPSQLTAAASNRVCNALALLQCVASHGETRGLFLGGELPLLCNITCRS